MSNIQLRLVPREIREKGADLPRVAESHPDLADLIQELDRKHKVPVREASRPLQERLYEFD